MPDFDKNLQPIIKDTGIPSEDIRVQAPKRYAPMTFPNYGGEPDLSTSGDPYSELEAASKRSDFREKGVFVTNATLDANRRYSSFNPTISNYEDFAAYGQSSWDKAANGVLKGLNLAATTIAGGFGTLYGIGKFTLGGKFSDIYDNEVMKRLDQWNEKVDNEYLPNYYTQAEKDAAWYSTDNWLTTNFLFDKLIKNAGFAVGAMYGGNIANAGLLRAGSSIGKLASGLAASAEASQSFKLFTPLLRNTARAFSAGKNAEAAAILEGELSSIADITAKSSKLAEIASATNQFAKFNDGARRIAIAAYSSAGEASFEAMQTSKEFRNKLIEEYKSTHGEEPTGDALKNIDEMSQKVGKAAFLGNMALLGVTEYVQLPKLMGSTYSSSRQAANSLLGRVDDVAIKDGKYVATGATTRFGKLYGKFTGTGRYIFDPKEAGQELGQFALQVGTQNYYNKANQTGDADAWVDGFLYGFVGKDNRGEGVGALVSKEGMESMILGGITGGLMQAKGNYKQSKATASNTATFIDSLNNAPTFQRAFKERLDAANRGIVLQQQQEQAVIQGDKLEAMDLQADMMHNYLAPRIKYGRTDMIMDDINELRSQGASEQGLAELKKVGMANISDTVESYQARLSLFETTVKNTDELYKAMNLRYGGELDENGNVKYSPNVIDKMVYAAAKIADYDIRIPAVNQTLAEAGVNTQDILNSIIGENKPNKEATAEALRAINNLDIRTDLKDELKSRLSDVIELSMRRKLFMDEFDDIKNKPLNYEVLPGYGQEIDEKDTTPVEVKQTDEEEGKKTLEIGKEYSLKEPIRKEGAGLILAPKIRVLSKTLGGEFEVRLPNGRTTFLSPEEFDEYNITEEDNTSKETADILDKAIDSVLSRPEFSDLKQESTIPYEELSTTVDKVNLVNSLDNQQVTDAIEQEFGLQSEEYFRKKEEERKRMELLAKSKEQIDKQQAEIEKQAGTTFTAVPGSEAFYKEGKLKAADILFISSTTESEEYEDPSKSSDHIRRSREFLNNAHKSPNRGNMRAILVTANQIDKLGLTGLVQMSYNVDQATSLDSIPNVMDVSAGFVAQVFVVQEGDKLFFVDKNGDKLTEVGQPADINQVVFQTMPTTSLTDLGGKNRFRSNEAVEAEEYSKAWGEFRKGLFNASPDTYTVYEFDISRGIPRTTEVDGRKETNQVGGVLIDEKKIASQEDLIIIPTTGTISHKGQLLKFPNGRPVLQFGDNLEYLQNNKFTPKQAKAIFKVIEALANDIVKQSEKGEKVEMNPAYVNFLRNLFYYKLGKQVSDNQININTDTRTINLGNLSIPLTQVSENEKAITEKIETIYHNVNNWKLTKEFHSKFYEFYLDENGDLQEREWRNYQTYLLASKYPDGSSRGMEETPLVTFVTPASDAVPYTHKQKYSTLVGVELPVKRVAPPVQPAPTPEAAPTVQKVGDYVADGTTENTITLKDPLGDTKFTASVENGVVNVKAISTEKTKAIAKDAAAVKPYIDALRNINQFDAALSEEELLLKFVSLRIGSSLQTIYNEQTKEQAPPPAPEAPAAEEKPTEEQKPYTPEDTTGPSDDYRLVGEEEGEAMTDAELQLFKEWHAKNVPGIPYEVLENIIKTHSGGRAWGVFEQGVAKFVRGGLRGTEYHEVFEGIWKAFLTEDERNAIVDELRASGKTFTDRATGKKLNYATATTQQIKERIADDFSDFRLGKLPARTLGEKIRRFFKAIMDFFKSFVTKPTLKEKLFKDIDMGRFKERTLSESVKNEAAEYRAVAGFTEKQTHEFVQDMTARAAGILFNEAKKKNLFTPDRITSKSMFDAIEQKYIIEKKREKMSDDTWNELKKKTKESLRTLGIEFNEEDRLDINDGAYDNRLYAPEPFSTDWKRTSPGAIKFTLATLLETEALNQEDKLSLQLPKAALSGIKGYKLLSFSRSFATMLDKLSNTTSVSKAMDKLLNLASYDANYVRLFQRIGGKMSNKTVPFDEFKNEDWRLFIQFMQTFTKQRPDALIQYKSGNEVYTQPANLYTAIKEVQRNWIEAMKTKAKNPAALVRYVASEKMYKADVGRVKDAKVKDPKEMIAFLNQLGIDFPIDVYSRLTDDNKKYFSKQISAIKDTLSKGGDFYSITSRTLQINGPASKLAELYVNATNPNQENTYYNVEGERTNSYSENNYTSVFENEFNEAETLDELLQTRPELMDLYNNGSMILKKGGLFFNEDGVRIKSMKVKYIQGTKIVDRNKGYKTTRLGLGDRMMQEINQNLNGDYYVIIPGDGSTEWMMSMGNNITYEDVASGRVRNKIKDIFIGYLKDDVALALDYDNRKQNRNIGAKGKELRFFKDILSQRTLDAINKMIADGSTQSQIEEYINSNIGNIASDVESFIQGTVDNTISNLTKTYNISQTVEENRSAMLGLEDSVARDLGINKESMSAKQLNDLITFVNINYAINNIEFHKVLFGDPYQFAIKNGILDETKRIKSFLSPRRTTFDTPEFNTFLNTEMNKAGETMLQPGDPGYHLHKSYANTATLKDAKIAGSLANIMSVYGNTNEADAASWLMDNTFREVRFKNGQWTDEAEAWHQWQMAYTRNRLAAKGKYNYSSEALKKHDENLLKKPAPKHTIEVLKPIVSGNKYGKTTMDIVLDKFSQMPIYYSMVEGTNMENLYMKMMEQEVGYVIVESGRKVGAEKLHSLYNQDGSFNEDAFNNNIQVPWKAYGIQVETISESPKSQTRGSQLTKLSSMDLFDNGEATEEAKKEYQRNVDILNKMHLNAYKELLLKLGIEDNGESFVLTDGIAISETLMNEMLRRELSDNIKDTVQLDENDQFRIPFEASPSYIQIRNILYSLVHKSLVSPKVNGGAHTQVPVTMFEKLGKNRGLALKTEKGEWMKITPAQYKNLPEDQKKDVVITDDTLKFYTKNDPYCEIMLPHWFKDKLSKGKYKTDEDILNYLNNTEEGRNILRGIGFRIPTQALASVEVFRVKGFLPQYMGATVVVPSEITTKAGSDFDIDKLNLYLKSVYIDASGSIKLVKYLGSEEATKEFFGQVFDAKLKQQKIKKAELLEANQILINSLEDPKGLLDRYSHILDTMLEDVEDGEDLSEYLMRELNKLGDVDFQAALKEKFVKDMYKKSLENEYYDSLEKLITLPENFERLITPTDDAGLAAFAKKLDGLRGYNEGDVKNKLLDRNFLTPLRHAFANAKRWVGIVATNITGHSLAQKSKIYIDPTKFDFLSARDAKFLGDGSMVLNHNTVTINGEERISLSGKYVKGTNTLISRRLSGYATAVVDVVKDPYVIKMMSSELVVGTTMFLERVGAGEQGLMFLQQPIIVEYLKMLDSIGSRTLFNNDNIQTMLMRFGKTTQSLIDTVGITVGNFEDNIEEYYSKGELSDAKNAEQQNILKEFLKYAKMAEQTFKFGQAINYDTTKFTSGDTLARKQARTRMAMETNIVSSVKDVLDSTFIGEQEALLSASAQAMGTILKLDQVDFRQIIDEVLTPYMENEYLSQEDYERIANRIRTSFLDYVIQIKSPTNTRIKELVADVSTSVATRLMQAKGKYPNLQILKDLSPISSERADGSMGIKLTAGIKGAYDENMYTGYMRELRDYNSETKALYEDIIYLSIIQGSYMSSVSIGHIIPIEDYQNIVAPIISPLVADEDVKNFANGWFQRNNFKDDDIMPTFSPMFWVDSYSEDEGFLGEELTASGDHYADIYRYVSPNFPTIKTLGVNPNDRRILILNEEYNSYHMQFDYLTVPRTVKLKSGDMVDMLTGQTVTKLTFAMRKQRGDMSLNDVYGYKRVMLKDGTPLTSVDKDGNVRYIYKLINLYGDGPFAKEYYNSFRPTVLVNGTAKIENEIPDDDIIQYYGGVPQKKDFGVPAITEKKAVTPKTPGLPEYFVDKTLKNSDGSKRFASTNKDGKITINPPASVQEFFDYFEGKEGGVTSQQKQKVLTKLGDAGWGMELIKSILKDVKAINTFLLLHEKSHVDNNDKDVYWKNGKDLLTEDKIAIETRATIDALTAMQSETQTLESTPPPPAPETSVTEVRYKDKEKRIRIDYPAKIEAETGWEFNSQDLIKASSVQFDGNRIAVADKQSSVGDYIEEIYNQYGDAAGQYVEVTDGSEISIPEAEFLRDNPEFAKDFINSFDQDNLAEGKTFQEYAQALLDKNETLVDTAQLSLFGDQSNLEGSDNPTPCS